MSTQEPRSVPPDRVDVAPSLSDFLVAQRGVEELRVATAYLTIDGARAAVKIGARVARFVVGLDDAVTAPDGLETLLDAGADVRVVQRGPSARFHPKLYWCRCAGFETAYVGSANLTRLGLSGNAELGLVIRGPREAAVPTQIEWQWNVWWDGAVTLTPAVLAAYADYHQRLAAVAPPQLPPAFALSAAAHVAIHGEFFAIRARLHGASRTVLQARGSLAPYFGLSATRAASSFRVEFGGAEFEVQAKLHDRGGRDTLQINFGRSGLGDALDSAAREDLLVFTEAATGRYRLDVVRSGSAQADEIIAATGHRAHRAFAAGVGRLD